MARNGQTMAIDESQIFIFFLTKWKKLNKNKIVIYVIVFDIIEVSIGQNLIFVKYTGAIVAKNDQKQV